MREHPKPPFTRDPRWIPLTCQVCGAEGKNFGGMTTLVGYMPAKCHDGVERRHDGNCANALMICPNGHGWGGPSPHTCECGWIQPWKECGCGNSQHWDVAWVKQEVQWRIDARLRQRLDVDPLLRVCLFVMQ